MRTPQSPRSALLPMHRGAALAGTGMALGTILTVAMARPALAVDAAQYGKLRQGQVVVQNVKPAQNPGAASAVQATVLIRRPPEQVFTVLRDSENLFKNDPSFKRVRVVKRLDANTELVEYTLKISPLLPAFVYTNKVAYVPNRASSFKRVAGSFEQMNGSAQLLPGNKPDETLFVYTLSLKPGVPVPQGIINGFLGSDLPRSLKLIQQRVYSRFPNT